MTWARASGVCVSVTRCRTQQSRPAHSATAQHFFSHPFQLPYGLISQEDTRNSLPTDTRGRGKHCYMLTDPEGDQEPSLPPRPLLRIKAATSHLLLPQHCHQCQSRASPNAQLPPLLTARRMDGQECGGRWASGPRKCGSISALQSLISVTLGSDLAKICFPLSKMR